MPTDDSKNQTVTTQPAQWKAGRLYRKSQSHLSAMNPNTGPSMIDKGARTTGMTSQSTPKHVLVQKLQGAIQNLRREREQEYREKVESEERLRLASEEQSSLATIVAGLKTKQENLRKRKATVETNIVQLEADVKDLTEKVRFQHNELLGARAKIQQKTREMEDAARANQENLDAIRQLAHERCAKTTAMAEKRFHRPTNTDTSIHDDTMKQRRREGLERELSCMMFEWETFPKLLEEKSRIYMEEAQFLAQLNETMALELGRRGIVVPPLSNSNAPAKMTGDKEEAAQTLVVETAS